MCFECSYNVHDDLEIATHELSIELSTVVEYLKLLLRKGVVWLLLSVVTYVLEVPVLPLAFISISAIYWALCLIWFIRKRRLLRTQTELSNFTETSTPSKECLKWLPKSYSVYTQIKEHNPFMAFVSDEKDCMVLINYEGNSLVLDYAPDSIEHDSFWEKLVFTNEGFVLHVVGNWTADVLKHSIDNLRR